MAKDVFFRAVGPIGNTDTNALPVKEIGPAVGYYTLFRVLTGLEGPLDGGAQA
jgi:hypothetical protein